MDTAVWILIIALVLVALGAAGFFFYKYYLEPHHVIDNIIHRVEGDQSSRVHEGSSSMAGHLVREMSEAKRHRRKAQGHLNKAQGHLNKAQAHAATA